MQLIQEADSIVRQLIPTVFDAAGLSEEAEEFRRLSPLEDVAGLAYACQLLAEFRNNGKILEENHPVWAEVIEEASFWGEAALWYAASGDIVWFRYSVDRIKSSISNLESPSLHLV